MGYAGSSGNLLRIRKHHPNAGKHYRNKQLSISMVIFRDAQAISPSRSGLSGPQKETEGPFVRAYSTPTFQIDLGARHNGYQASKRILKTLLRPLDWLSWLVSPHHRLWPRPTRPRKQSPHGNKAARVVSHVLFVYIESKLSEADLASIFERFEAEFPNNGRSWDLARFASKHGLCPSGFVEDCDQSQEALRNVEKITDSEPVSGEQLVESEDLI